MKNKRDERFVVGRADGVTAWVWGLPDDETINPMSRADARRELARMDGPHATIYELVPVKLGKRK